MQDRHSPLARIRRVGLATLLALVTAGPVAAWERSHGDGANLNFQNVATAPAGSLGEKAITGLGTFAPGAGPVIAADGTIYLGNEQGEVIALHADGSPYWRRQIAVPQGVIKRPPILASPALGADGMVYVIASGSVRDHRAGKPPRIYESSLHRFTASGGYLGATMFPIHTSGGYVPAAPNITRARGKEMVLVPAVYGRSVRLIGFDTDGALAADQLVTAFDPTVHGGNDLPAWQNVFCGLSLGIGCLGRPFQEQGNILLPPPPGIGVFTPAGGGEPIVVVSDHKHDVAGFIFANGAFVEVFRVHDESLILRGPPTILPNGHTLIGVSYARIDNLDTPNPSPEGGAIFTGPDLVRVAPVQGIGAIYATTRLADGRILLHDGFGRLTVLQNNAVASTVKLGGTSLVAPVASQTHVFVSTATAFVTLEVKSLRESARFYWTHGGDSQPAIGPKGDVYGLAGDRLYVFPAPGARADGQDVQEPATPMAQSDGREFKPPLLASGNRLFACETLDGDDCGKDDYTAIATAFCQKQGFAGAGQVKVDSKKVIAETLDGRFCSKKKCKVFKEITCKS